MLFKKWSHTVILGFAVIALGCANDDGAKPDSGSNPSPQAQSSPSTPIDPSLIDSANAKYNHLVDLEDIDDETETPYWSSPENRRHIKSRANSTYKRFNRSRSTGFNSRRFDRNELPRLARVNHSDLAFDRLPTLWTPGYRDNTHRAWQDWAPPYHTTALLNDNELDGPGDRQLQGDIIARGKESRTTLVKASALRCSQIPPSVSESRIDSSQFEHRIKVKHVPAPFGERELYCVRRSASINTWVDLAISRRGEEFMNVRWIGSTAEKTIPIKGRHDLEFKMTVRLNYKERFEGAALNSQKDRMDVLLALKADSTTDQKYNSCALERVYYLKVTFNDGFAVDGELMSVTRQVDVEEFMKLQNNDMLSPQRRDLPLKALSACNAQHSAWVHCMNPESISNKSCHPVLIGILEQNFGRFIKAYGGDVTAQDFIETVDIVDLKFDKTVH